MMGKDEAARMDWGWAYLAERFELKRKRRQFIPAISRKQKGRLWVQPVKYHGPADLVALRDAEYLIEIPPDAPPLSKGKRVRILRLLGRPSNSSLETEE
jgi:molybdopterin biosynthesis enzyme